jgi:hypothetical protein
MTIFLAFSSLAVLDPAQAVLVIIKR